MKLDLQHGEVVDDRRSDGGNQKKNRGREKEESSHMVENPRLCHFFRSRMLYSFRFAFYCFIDEVLCVILARVPRR